MGKQCKMKLWSEVVNSGELRRESGARDHVYG